MPKYNHKIHKYGKVQPRKKDNPNWVIFKCFIPGCNHYLHGEVMVQGRESICWLCGESFIMTDKNLVTKPECAPCRGDLASPSDLTPEQEHSDRALFLEPEERNE